MDKEEKLRMYSDFEGKVIESENFLDQLVRDKEQREEELLNKMSNIADHYHQEKEKNTKLMNELTR